MREHFINRIRSTDAFTPSRSDCNLLASSPFFMRASFFLLIFASCSISFAETRSWKNADGSRSVQGQYLKRDAKSVTILGAGGAETTILFSQLHAEDIKWLEEKHPFSAAKPANHDAVFDTLTFKDTRDSALQKLKSSKLVESSSNEVFMGRTGMNGVFKTRQKIGGLQASLYFDWTEAGALQEIDLQTDPVYASEYKSKLEPCWKEFIELLISLHGHPAHAGKFPDIGSLPNDTLTPTHLWKLKPAGTITLGASKEGPLHKIVVRFSEKKKQVIEMR